MEPEDRNHILAPRTTADAALRKFICRRKCSFYRVMASRDWAKKKAPGFSPTRKHCHDLKQV